MSLYNRVITDLNNRRDRLISGKINAIPWNLPRFEEYSPGIEKGKYYIITGQTKSAKSQITDHLFVYNAFRQIKENNLPVKLVVKYFSLEMSEEEKMTQMISNLLFIKSGMNIIISPTNLRSTRKVLDSKIIDIIETHREYIEEFLQCVEFISTIKNPFGIFNHMRKYAQDHGIQHKKIVDYGEGPIEVDDYYEENNPEEYVICIVDHASLVQPEHGNSIQQAINDLSSKYFIQLRNKYKQIIVLVQQQAFVGENLDSIKANATRPTLANLAESKLTARDSNITFGIFSPFKFQIPEYNGYNIKHLKDNVRFLEILSSRDGGAGAICPLYFNGAVNYFSELPKSDDLEKMKIVERKVTEYRNNEIK